jgi:hypothetical protein
MGVGRELQGRGIENTTLANNGPFVHPPVAVLRAGQEGPVGDRCCYDKRTERFRVRALLQVLEDMQADLERSYSASGFRSRGTYRLASRLRVAGLAPHGKRQGGRPVEDSTSRTQPRTGPADLAGDLWGAQLHARRTSPMGHTARPARHFDIFGWRRRFSR